MKISTIFLVFVSTVFFTIPSASAFLIDSEGENTSGANDTRATSQPIGTLIPDEALSVIGWVDSNNTNDIDFYSFSLNGSTDVYFDIDYADDFESANDVDAGLDTYLSVFNDQDQLIAYNDDNESFIYLFYDPGSIPFGDLDSFIGALPLGPGTYFAAVSSYFNAPNALSNQAGNPGFNEMELSISGYAVSGSEPDATYDMDGRGSVGPYLLQVRVTEEDQPIGTNPVPEPSTIVLVAVGLLGIAGFARRGLRKGPG